MNPLDALRDAALDNEQGAPPMMDAIWNAVAQKILEADDLSGHNIFPDLIEQQRREIRARNLHKFVKLGKMKMFQQPQEKPLSEGGSYMQAMRSDDGY